MRVLGKPFSTEMVLAILDGRKTCDRVRIKKNRIDAVLGSSCRKNNPNIPDKNFIEKLIMPPCEKGDIRYVRETWNEWEGGYVYKAWPDGILQPGSYGTWRPSTNMPKVAVRIWLKVTDVRVERLQDITEEQTRAEGVLLSEVNKTYSSLFEHANVSTQMELYGTTSHYIFEFKYTWNKTVDKKKLEIYGWSANPWVWVIEFERCEKPEELI